MGSDDSLNQSMNAAVKHYASLFKLPSYTYVVLFLALICIGGASVSTMSLFRSYEGLASGALLGVSLFLATLFLDYLSSKLVMRRDPIYDLRRTSTLSLFCWAMWLFFIFFGSITGMLYGASWWIRFCLLGFSTVLIFRLIVVNATSFLDAKRIVLASLLWPCLNMTPFIVLWTETGYPITFQIIIFFVFSSVLGLIMCYFFLFLVNDVANGTLGVPALSLFKAFLLSWIVDLNVPFEGFLERLSKQQSVELALLRFDSLERKVCMVIPSIHPGPFKNIGSSILPSLLKDALEEKFSCIACVPHGLFGHELDLASQTQNQKVIDNVIDAMDFPASEGAASPFVTTSNGLASACCQIFGDVAFLSVTLSPRTTEDLPQELGLFVQDRALQLGLACCAVVNAHNSIDGMNSMPEALNSLKSVSASCLERAASMPRLQFEIGASTVHPTEFRLRDGLGYGGITVIVSRTANQKAAFVVIDGNNIISGLREKILSALSSIGIDAGEVFTTDTHSVSGIVLGRRGYHPIGEVMDHEKLIDYIKRATHAALADLNRAKAGCRTISVSNVKVIGSQQLASLSLLTDKGLQRAKKAIIPISLISGLVLMLFLLFV